MYVVIDVNEINTKLSVGKGTQDGLLVELSSAYYFNRRQQEQAPAVLAGSYWHVHLICQ